MKIKKLILPLIAAIGIGTQTAKASEITPPKINQINIEEGLNTKPIYKETKCQISNLCIHSNNKKYELGHFDDFKNLISSEPDIVSKINSSKEKDGSILFDLSKLDLIIGGTSYHSYYITDKNGEKYDFNKNNQIFGAKYNFDEVFSIDGGIYKDSFKANSEWLALNYMPIKLNLIRNNLYLKFGVAITGTHKQLMIDEGKKWIIYPIPKIQIGSKFVKLDIGLIFGGKDHSNKRRLKNTIITGQISIPLNF